MQIRSSLAAVRNARFLWAATTLFSAAASAPAAAADFAIGVGGGAADGHVDCVSSLPCDHSSTSWKVFADWRLNDAFELRATAFDAGTFKGGDTAPSGSAYGGSFRVEGFGLTGGYRWALAPAWSLVGRAGVASVHTLFEYANSSLGDVGKTGVQPLLGLGLAWQLTPAVSLGLDYDFTRFEAHSSHGPLNLLGVAAQYSF